MLALVHVRQHSEVWWLFFSVIYVSISGLDVTRGGHCGRWSEKVTRVYV